MGTEGRETHLAANVIHTVFLIRASEPQEAGGVGWGGGGWIREREDKKYTCSEQNIKNRKKLKQEAEARYWHVCSGNYRIDSSLWLNRFFFN